MSKTPGFYVGQYRCWIDENKEAVWLEHITQSMQVPIGLDYLGQVIEMLQRQSNARKYTPDAQVRSTDDD